MSSINEHTPYDLAVIGNPIAHSLSPQMHTAMLRFLGEPFVYGRFCVSEEDLLGWLHTPEAKRLRGFNVTMPHKTAMLDAVHFVSPEAARIGAINTVVVREDGLYGYNTDGIGVVRLLDSVGMAIEKRHVTVLGAGGAARAAVCGLLGAGVASVTVCCRDPQRANMLEEALVKPWSALTEVMSQTDLLINATPLGMHGVNRDFDNFCFLDQLPHNASVCDLIYMPRMTTLLIEAERRGLVVVGGLGMLVHQGIAALELFLGRELDNSVLERVAMDIMP